MCYGRLFDQVFLGGRQKQLHHLLVSILAARDEGSVAVLVGLVNFRARGRPARRGGVGERKEEGKEEGTQKKGNEEGEVGYHAS